ncbi:Cytochrome o ubiquinol oxidase subunit III [Planctomycetales bacterium 10988]|nr:Cytochrome o ubiquinol oxidase subunit III [Planctomycetales bacterium 10988]
MATSEAIAETSEDHAEHDHPAFLAHHFDTPQQQFDSGKLGMWLFLVTEILFFSGLFTAYIVYRYLHPEIFIYAHQYLDTTLGAFNTCVLIFSSLTMAWAVRCAQLNQRVGLIVCLTITLVCAGLFLVVKYFEYTHKFHEGLYWAGWFDPHSSHGHEDDDILTGEGHHDEHAEDSHASEGHEEGSSEESASGESETLEGGGNPPPPTPPEEDMVSAVAPPTGFRAPLTPLELQMQSIQGNEAEVGEIPVPAALSFGEEKEETDETDIPRNAGIFFSIYYCMTGLHAIHIVAGMIAIGWLLVRSCMGHFNEQYFGPVDYVGLYWHLVDLIWIYLFPLLYLIR